MSRKRYTPEQIIGKLREAEVALAQGETVGQVCRTLGIAEQTFYRWRQEYGGLKVEQARRLKALEQENTRLRGAQAAPPRSLPYLALALNGKLIDRLKPWSPVVEGAGYLISCWVRLFAPFASFAPAVPVGLVALVVPWILVPFGFRPGPFSLPVEFGA